MPADRPPAAPRRRRLLAALAGSLGLAGCQSFGDRSSQPPTERTSTEPTPSESTTANSQTTAGTSGETTTDTAEPETTRPRTPGCADCTILRARYVTGENRDPPLDPVGDQDAAVARLTDDEPPEVDYTELPDDATRFLDATEFDREHAVMVQYRSTSGGRKLQLTSLEREGERQRVRLEAPYWGALQAETRRLVLVRIPTPERGPPTSAVARIVVEDYVDVQITPDGVDIDRPE